MKACSDMSHLVLLVVFELDGAVHCIHFFQLKKKTRQGLMLNCRRSELLFNGGDDKCGNNHQGPSQRACKTLGKAEWQMNDAAEINREGFSGGCLKTWDKN